MRKLDTFKGDCDLGTKESFASLNLHMQLQSKICDFIRLALQAAFLLSEV